MVKERPSAAGAKRKLKIVKSGQRTEGDDKLLISMSAKQDKSNGLKENRSAMLHRGNTKLDMKSKNRNGH